MRDDNAILVFQAYLYHKLPSFVIKYNIIVNYINWMKR